MMNSYQSNRIQLLSDKLVACVDQRAFKFCHRTQEAFIISVTFKKCARGKGSTTSFLMQTLAERGGKECAKSSILKH